MMFNPPEGKTVLNPVLYGICEKRWGKEYMEKHHIRDDQVPTKPGSYRRLIRNLRKEAEK